MADATHTPGPLVALRINDTAKPYAVINPRGPHGDEIVGGYINEADAHLYAAAPDLLRAAKRALGVLKAQGESVRPGNALGALDAAIAKAEDRP